MVSIRANIREGTKYSRSADGEEYVRIFYVSDYDSGPATARAKSVTALSAIPNYGAKHPDIAGIFVQQINVDNINGDDTQFKIECIYRTPKTDDSGGSDEGQNATTVALSSIEVGTTLKTKRRNIDTSGKQIKVSYTYPQSRVINVGGIEYKVPAEHIGKTVSYATGVDVDTPVATVSQTLVHNFNPASRVVSYVGHVNGSPEFGGAARTWLCTGIRARSEDGGNSFVTTYEFAYDPDSWDEPVPFEDPVTGKSPPSQIQDGSDVVTFHSVRPTAFFGSLGLNISV